MNDLSFAPKSDFQMRQMRAIQLSSPGMLEDTVRVIPEPVADEILLRTKAVTICSTDVSYFHGNLQPDSYPVVLGHEYVGEVIAVGEEQPSDLIGKRVVYFGQTDFDGLAAYRLLRPLFPGENKSAPFKTKRYFTDDGYAAAIVVPDQIDDTAAPLLEPITAVPRTILKHPPNVGDKALVLGGGPCGAIAGAILGRIFATERVDVLERDSDRAERARTNYADHVHQSAGALVRANSSEPSYDYVFDALPPLPNTAEEDDPRRAALKAARPEATYILYGASMKMQKFDTWLMLAKGVNIKSAAFDVGYYPMRLTAQVMKTSLALLENGIVSSDWVVTREADFSDTSAIKLIFDEYENNPDLKTVVRFND